MGDQARAAIQPEQDKTTLQSAKDGRESSIFLVLFCYFAFFSNCGGVEEWKRGIHRVEKTSHHNKNRTLTEGNPFHPLLMIFP